MATPVKFPHPARMVFEALRRTQNSHPTTQTLWSAIHELYPAPPAPASSSFKSRTVNSIVIPASSTSAPHPNHPIKSMRYLKEHVLPLLTKRGLLEHRQAPEFSARRNAVPAFSPVPPPLDASLTYPVRDVPEMKAAVAMGKMAEILAKKDVPLAADGVSALRIETEEGKIPSQWIWRFSPEFPQPPPPALGEGLPASSHASFSSSSASASSSSPIPLDADGLPSMPPKWNELLQTPQLGFQPWDRLARKVGHWQSQSMSPRTSARTEEPIPRQRHGLPVAKASPPLPERQQFAIDLKRFSGLNRNRQGARWDKTLEQRKWRKGMETSFAMDGRGMLEEGKERESQRSSLALARRMEEARVELEQRLDRMKVFST